MASKLSRSKEEQSHTQVYEYWQNARQGLQLVFQQPQKYQRFLGMTVTELEVIFERQQQELDYQASLSLLASIEAAFQLDFHHRVNQRLRDPLSRHFKDLKNTTPRISFENHILYGWQQYAPVTKKLFQPLNKAIKYRHWLAHGRYWLHKSPIFNFAELYELAELIQNSIDFKKF